MSNNTDSNVPSRREFLKSTTGALGAAALGLSALEKATLAEGATSRQPNFLFVLGEGIRSDEFHATGNAIIQTPNFDRVVREGMTFKNAFVVNALCLPSRASILTGQYSHVTGAIDNRDRPIPAQYPIISDLLRDAGYEVAFIGKSHVAGAMHDRYWDYFFGFNGQTNYFHPVMSEAHQGNFGKPTQYHGYVDDLLTDRAVEWVSRRHDKPFCLFLWFYAPHAPFVRPRSLANLYNGTPIPVPDTFDDDLKAYPGKPHVVVAALNKIGPCEVAQDDPRTLEELTKNHYAGVVSNDVNLGRVMDALEREGTLDETAIIVSSDHGFFLGEFHMYDKRLMYDPSVRVPLTIRYPAKVPADSSTDKMALNLDIAPTMIELAGAQIPKEMQGRSLVPLLQGRETANWRQDWLYEYYEYPEYEHVAPHRGIRTDRYKLIHYYLAPEQFELYDLKSDPHERTNLYSDPQYASLVAHLRARIEELRRETQDTGKYDVTKAYIDAAPQKSVVRMGEVG